jgi:hypothetical protein
MRSYTGPDVFEEMPSSLEKEQERVGRDTTKAAAAARAAKIQLRRQAVQEERSRLQIEETGATQYEFA